MARQRRATASAEKPKKAAPAAFANVDEEIIPSVEEKAQKGDMPAQKMFTQEEVNKIVQEAAAKAVAEAMANAQPSRVYVHDKEDMVTILYMDECADDNVLLLPNYGSITPGGFLEIPKKEFTSSFMSLLARDLIANRKLIVMDGLTEAERIRWKVNYNKGEILDVEAFDRMLDLDTDEIVRIFKSLCVEHKKFVVSRFMAAYFPENGGMHDNRISLEKARALNEASRDIDPKGMFQRIVDAAVKEQYGA